ncbi:MAG: DNA polymerase III subunit delta [Gemmatimonadota bacterium]
MPLVPFDTAFKAIRKGDLPRALYLYGAEEVLKEELVAEVLSRALDPALKDFNLDLRSATVMDPEEVETLCYTLPMMSDRRVAVVRDVEAWNKRTKAKAQVVKYLTGKPAPETVLILWQGGADPDPDPELVRCTTAVAAEPLSPERARKWLQMKATELGLELSPEAAIHLARVTEGSLGAIRTELAKFSGLVPDGVLSLEQVGQLLGIRHGETQYDWREAVLANEPARAVAMLPYVLSQSGVSGVSLVILLGTGLVGLGLARAHFDRGLRGSQLTAAVKSSLIRARPPRMSYDAAAAEWSRHAPEWTAARVRAALEAARAADERLKTTTLGDERAILTDLVMQICLLRQRAA